MRRKELDFDPEGLQLLAREARLAGATSPSRSSVVSRLFVPFFSLRFKIYIC